MSGVIKGETEKPKVITAKISVEVVDNDDRFGKMSAKRRAFIRRREKRIARNYAILSALATVGTTFISNIYVALILFTIGIFVTLIFLAFYDAKKDHPSDSWITPWWYGGL